MQFNRGTSAMQHYVATRPMFIDVEIMNADTRLVLGDQAAQASPSNVARGLSSLYKEITGSEYSFFWRSASSTFYDTLFPTQSLLLIEIQTAPLLMWSHVNLVGNFNQ